MVINDTLPVSINSSIGEAYEIEIPWQGSESK